MSLENKTILVTGGTGSFGSNFIKTVLKNYKPKRIRIYSRDEHKQEDLISSLHSEIVDGFIGDVRDASRLNRAMEGADIVIHAAALKRVQSCEYNPFETIKTNIIGSMNVIDCALNNAVEKVIAISSDKAVAPINLYGSTKMCMEKLFVHANNYRGRKNTKMSCVRYGNVIGARGSVIPIWQDKIIRGEIIPLTDPQATRFWIKMDEAVHFVCHAIELMDVVSGGEIFVPKLPSVRLIDLFHAFADSSQFTIIGLRVGDKLHETLIPLDEMPRTIEQDSCFIVLPQNPTWFYDKPVGRSCENCTAYSSDINNEFLALDEIKQRLEEIY